MSAYEIIGITGTTFVLLAFMQNEERQIRMLDLIGAILFCIYGALTKTYSTAFLNLMLVGIQLYKLFKKER